MKSKVSPSVYQNFFAILIVFSTFTLTACVSVTQVPSSGDANQLWESRSDYLYKQNHWEAHLSLIGVSHQQKFKTRAVWLQDGDHYIIKLRDFIGRTVAVIEGSPEGVNAKTSKGQKFQGETAEQLIKQLFDINIPVSGMRYWLLGIPKPNVDVARLQLDDHGLAELIDQQDWSMVYSQYKDNNSLNMPAQMMLGYNDIDLQVKVSQWTFHAE